MFRQILIKIALSHVNERLFQNFLKFIIHIFRYLHDLYGETFCSVDVIYIYIYISTSYFISFTDLTHE